MRPSNEPGYLHTARNRDCLHRGPSLTPTEPERKRLGEILLERGTLSMTQLQRALAHWGTVQTTDNIWDGFDWACVAEDQGLLTPDPRYADACGRQLFCHRVHMRSGHHDGDRLASRELLRRSNRFPRDAVESPVSLFRIVTKSGMRSMT